MAPTPQELHVWRPLPPSDDFVALGYAVTSTEQPPGTDWIRCVRADFATRCEEMEPVWSDRSNDRPRSIWRLAGEGGLGLLIAAPGQGSPEDARRLSEDFLAWVHSNS